MFKFALNNRRSVLGKNFRYLAFKYKIKCSYWYKNWSYINSCISDFLSNSYNQDVFIEEKNIVYLICMNWKNLYNSYQHSVLCTCTYGIAMLTYICSLCVFHVSIIMYS